MLRLDGTRTAAVRVKMNCCLARLWDCRTVRARVNMTRRNQELRMKCQSILARVNSRIHWVVFHSPAARRFTLYSVSGFAAALSLAVWASAVMPVAGAQNPQVVEIWPSQAPEEAGNLGPERVVMS